MRSVFNFFLCPAVLSCFHRVQLFMTPWVVCSPPGSSVHEIFQARILEWVTISSSRGSSRSRDGTPVSCIAGGFFTTVSPRKPLHLLTLPPLMLYLGFCSIKAKSGERPFHHLLPWLFCRQRYKRGLLGSSVPAGKIPKPTT